MRLDGTKTLQESLCVNCGEEIYFGGPLTDGWRKYAKYHQETEYWRHTSTGSAGCVMTFAKPISGHVL